MQGFALFCQRRHIALIPFCLILLSCGLWSEMELLVPSLPEMKHFFAVGDASIQQLLTANFVGFFIGVLIAGPLCDSLGRKIVLCWGGFLYLLCCLACALAPSFYLLIGARFLQGLVMTGPLLATGVLLFEHTSGEKQLFWMAMANSVVTFCMAAAPLIGAWVTGLYGYQGNLWLILMLGGIGIVPALCWVPETLAASARQPLALKRLAGGYLHLLRDRRFMLLSLPVCALASGYWIYVGVSALYLVDYLGVPAAEFGRYQGPIVGCFSLLSLGSGRLLRLLGLYRNLLLGCSSMLIGCGLLVAMSGLRQENALLTTVFMMLFVGGMAPICSLLFPLAMNHLPQDLQGKAQALIQAMRLMCAAAGTGALGFLYSGPLLPVALMLMGLLLAALMCLWCARGYLQQGVEAPPGVMVH